MHSVPACPQIRARGERTADSEADDGTSNSCVMRALRERGNWSLAEQPGGRPRHVSNCPNERCGTGARSNSRKFDRARKNLVADR